MEAKTVRYELPEFDLDAYVPYRLAVAATQLSKGLAEQYRQRFGISITEWRVLVNVGYSDKTSVRDIEHRVSLDKSKVSRAATRLEAAGYVIKSVDETDRRLIRLELTDAGAALLSEIVPFAQDYQRRLEAALGARFDAFQDTLAELMEIREL